MRSKILQQIIDETPQEVKEQVDRLASDKVNGVRNCYHSRDKHVRHDSGGFKCKCGYEVAYF